MARKKITPVATDAPSRQAWQQLYAVAVTFRDVQPWELMTEDEIFGVEDPVTGEVNYCMITGELGEHQALIVTLGARGLGDYYDALRRLEVLPAYLEDLDAGFSMMLAPQIQASFEDREMLTSEDRQIIKSLGLRFRGSLAWPMFRYYEPGRAPWYLTAESARLLTVALEQALQVIMDIEWIDEQYTTRPAELNETVPVRYFNGTTWEYRWDKPIPHFPQYDYPVDAAQLAQVAQRLPMKKAELEFHLTIMHELVQEGPLPPYYPHMILLADSQTGMVLSQKVLIAQPSLEAMLQSIPYELIAMFEQLNMRPQHLYIATERLQRILTAPLAHLGVQLKRVIELPAIEEALAAFEEFLKGGMFDDMDFDDEIDSEGNAWNLAGWDIKEAA